MKIITHIQTIGPVKIMESLWKMNIDWDLAQLNTKIAHLKTSAYEEWIYLL